MSSNRILSLVAIVALTIGSCAEQTDPAHEQNALFRLVPASESNMDFVNTVTDREDFHYFKWDHAYSGSGIGVGDINNDGLEDIFVAAPQLPDRLYLNKGGLKFEDISESAGIGGGESISTGVAFGDVNADGFLDIYVCKSGFTDGPGDKVNKLFINNGDLTFAEQAVPRGVGDGGYSVHSAFFDYDKDGDLDLYVLNQPPSTRVEKKDVTFTNEAMLLSQYNPTDRLYENNGRGVFIDISEAAGIKKFAYGLGVVTSDLNDDNWPDVYVSNDFHKSDQVFVNDREKKFVRLEDAMLRHTAWFSMGMDINDFNNDGLPDILTVDMPGKNHYRSKTNMGSMSPQLFEETLRNGQLPQFMFNVLQMNNGDGTFSDIGHFAGISKTDWSWSGVFGDYDNDGLKDIFITNGIKRDIRNNDFIVAGQKEIAKVGERNINPLELLKLAPQNPISNFMYHNKGDMKFEDITAEWGLDLPGFSHGMAHADLDLDGDLDIVINNVDSPVSIYENQSTGNNWIRLVLNGGPDNRSVVGAKVYLQEGGQIQFQELLTSRGYMSSSENAIHFGIGKNTAVDRITVLWPDDRTTTLENPAINTVHKLSVTDAADEPFKLNDQPALFRNVGEQYNIIAMHREYAIDDYQKQVLLPYKYSYLGPPLATGDVNGDGLEDIFMGGSANHSGLILFQTRDGKFEVSYQEALITNKPVEDLGAEFLDIDGDGDLDLYVACGSYEFEYTSPGNYDQIYLNDGTGKMIRTNFNGVQTVTKSIATGDMDNDGDVDLFVGGRVVPGQYPLGPPSYLFDNNNGFLADATNRIVLAPGTVIGMVTDSEFSDYDNDGDLDLIVVGEWTPVKIFRNDDGIFYQLTENQVLDGLKGLWQSITPGDFNGDGNVDYLLGNIGTNNKFKASPENPFKVLGEDFDKNGKYDVVLVTYYDGKEVPTRGRECSSQQLPFIADKFPTFEEFANASISDIFDEEMQEKALHLEITTFESGVLMNLGGGQFEFRKLPNICQIAPIMGAVAKDFDNDGNVDLVCAGNLNRTEIETLPYDAGVGMFMKGKGNGEFEVLRGKRSGTLANADAKTVEMPTMGNGSTLVLVGNNNTRMQAFEWIGTPAQ